MADPGTSASRRRSVLRRPSSVAIATVVLAAPFVAYLVSAAGQPVEPWAVLAFFAAFLVAERLTVTVEVRSQTFTCSVGEAALVLALVELGGAWTAVAWTAAISVICIRDPISVWTTVANVAGTVMQAGVIVVLLESLRVGSVGDTVR